MSLANAISETRKDLTMQPDRNRSATLRQFADELDADPTIDVIAYREKIEEDARGLCREAQSITWASRSAAKRQVAYAIKKCPFAMPPIWQLILLRCGIRVGVFRDAH